jgi:nitroreductase
MDIFEALETRRSCRAFAPDPVPREIIEQIIRTASRSPSFANSQPWEVAVVSGQKLKDLGKKLLSLAEANAPSTNDIPLPRSWPPEHDKRIHEHGAKRFKVLGIERENDPGRDALRLANYNFYGAPCALFLHMDRALTSWSIFDMGCFAQSILLEARAHGLGSCLQAVLVNYSEEVREFLGIPQSKMLVIGISIGYPDNSARINTYRSDRKPPAEFIKWIS